LSILPPECVLGNGDVEEGHQPSIGDGCAATAHARRCGRMARVSPFRSFTQGTLFSCACAEAYPGKNVYGLVITARCDTAHGKANIINYVPVVSVEDWISVDGCVIVARRLLAEGAAGMRTALRDAGLAPEILETIDINDIVSELQKDKSRAGIKIAERFLKTKDAVGLAQDWLDGRSSMTGVGFLNQNRKLYFGVVRDLLSHSLSDFHFIEALEPDEDSNGYVALLREIRFVPVDVAEAVAEGLDEKGIAARFSSERWHSTIQLSFAGPDAYAMPLSTITSPDIEFIMQRLTQLFARVGVADIPRERTMRLHNLLPDGGNG
jgi:hypothetical protein